MKYILLGSIFLISCMRLLAQKPDTSLIYYNLGVKAFEQKSYLLADSLFSLSIKKLDHPDTYFSRAICRQKMGNTQGYCEDLCAASVLGDTEARSLFLKGCGKIDTAYTDSRNTAKWKTNYMYQLVFYKSMYPNANVVLKYDRLGKFLESYKIKKELSDSIAGFAQIEEQAKFPGGIPALQNYIKNNLRYPAEAREAGISGTVLLKFIINETGVISNIKVQQGIHGCMSCDAEAVKLVEGMPKWEPARMSGTPVKCYFNLPVSFKITR